MAMMQSAPDFSKPPRRPGRSGWWVGLDLGVDVIGDAGLIQHVGDLLGDAELQQVGVRADQGLFQAAAGDFPGDLLDSALPW